MKARVKVCVLLIFGALPCGLVPAQENDVSKKEIRKTLNSPDSFIRHNTWKKLNAENSRQYKVLTQILQKLSWYDRDGAIIALAKAATDETLEKMLRDLKKHRNPMVRQGMAMALAKMNDPKYYRHLYDALDDKAPFVRRMVVHALRVHKKNAAVDALVERFQKEDDPVVRTFLESSLNELTQAYQGPNPTAWLLWWTQAKTDKDYKLGNTDEEAVKAAEKLGRKLRRRRTVAAGVTLTSSERGSGDGIPILIIPPYGFSKNIMLPFLSELEKNHKLYYVDLPPIKSFDRTRLKFAGKTDIPYYPTELLVDAFEHLREDTEQERFAIMACGLNAWIAMRYAAQYPKSLAAMILVAPLSSTKEFGAATDRLNSIGQKKKDREMWHLGMSRRFNTETGESGHDAYHRENKVAKPEGEAGSIDRRSWSLFFKDESDGLISILYPKKNHPMGRVAFEPRFSLFKEEPPPVRIPTVVVAGKASLYTSVADCKAIAKYYKGVPYILNGSSCMPFAEESKQFNRTIGAFLKRYARPRRTAKKPDDDEKKGKSAGRDRDKGSSDKEKKKKSSRKRTKKRSKKRSSRDKDSGDKKDSDEPKRRAKKRSKKSKEPEEERVTR